MEQLESFPELFLHEKCFLGSVEAPKTGPGAVEAGSNQQVRAGCADRSQQHYRT